MSLNIPQEANLVYYSPMNTNSGSVVKDYSDSGVDTTISGAEWGKNSFNGHYDLYYTGGDYDLSTSTVTLSGTTTIAYWMKSTQAANHGIFGIVTYSNVAVRKMIYIGGGGTTMRYGDGAVDSEFPSLYGSYDGNWHLVVFSEESSVVSLYIDGVFKASLPTGNSSATTTVMGGQLANNTSFTYTGYLSDRWLWNGSALTQEEITKLYKDTYRN